MKKKAYWISAIIVIILIIAGVFAFNKHQQQENDVQSIRKKVTSKEYLYILLPWLGKQLWKKI